MTQKSVAFKVAPISDRHTMNCENGAIVLESGTIVLGNRAIVLGNRAIVLGNRAIVLGNGAIVLGNGAVVLGSRSIVLGNGAVVLKNRAIVFGNGVVVPGNNSTVYVKKENKTRNKPIKNRGGKNMPDYIPRNSAMFKDFAKNFCTQIQTNKALWNLPNDPVLNLRQLNDTFVDFYNNTIGPHTPAQKVSRNTAQANLTKEIRQFVNEFLRFNRVLTDADRTNLGLHIPDTIKTKHTEVHEEVDFGIRIKSTNNVIIDFKVLGATGKAKPAGYSGAVIIWTLADEKPEKNDDFTGHTLATKTPHTIEFDDDDSGKKVWVKACWQNARGILGRWSEAQSAVVP